MLRSRVLPSARAAQRFFRSSPPRCSAAFKDGGEEAAKPAATRSKIPKWALFLVGAAGFGAVHVATMDSYEETLKKEKAGVIFARSLVKAFPQSREGSQFSSSADEIALRNFLKGVKMSGKEDDDLPQALFVSDRVAVLPPPQFDGKEGEGSQSSTPPPSICILKAGSEITGGGSSVSLHSVADSVVEVAPGALIVDLSFLALPSLVMKLKAESVAKYKGEVKLLQKRQWPFAGSDEEEEKETNSKKSVWRMEDVKLALLKGVHKCMHYTLRAPMVGPDSTPFSFLWSRMGKTETTISEGENVVIVTGIDGLLPSPSIKRGNDKEGEEKGQSDGEKGWEKENTFVQCMDMMGVENGDNVQKEDFDNAKKEVLCFKVEPSFVEGAVVADALDAVAIRLAHLAYMEKNWRIVFVSNDDRVAKLITFVNEKVSEQIAKKRYYDEGDGPSLRQVMERSKSKPVVDEGKAQ